MMPLMIDNNDNNNKYMINNVIIIKCFGILLIERLKQNSHASPSVFTLVRRFARSPRVASVDKWGNSTAQLAFRTVHYGECWSN